MNTVAKNTAKNTIKVVLKQTFKSQETKFESRLIETDARTITEISGTLIKNIIDGRMFMFKTGSKIKGFSFERKFDMTIVLNDKNINVTDSSNFKIDNFEGLNLRISRNKKYTPEQNMQITTRNFEIFKLFTHTAIERELTQYENQVFNLDETFESLGESKNLLGA